MELQERFRYIMKLNQLTSSAFADEIGVQKSSISHILSGRNKPSLEFIQKVLTRFPKVDASWLINGTTNIDPNSESIKPDVTQREQTISLEKKGDSIDKKPSELSDIEISSYGNKQKARISKIVVFYEDNSFQEFTP